MTYTVKEIFYSLQGEGARAGRAAVFCRFSGCNLWTGQERDRPAAICTFCDTDFVGVGPDGGKFASAADLAAAALARWPAGGPNPYVVCTGGEPLLQLDQPLVDAFHDAGFEVAIETNGTLPAPRGIDWICVSPKASAPLALTSGDELKLVYPQHDAPPEHFEGLHFHQFFLQPMDGSDVNKNTEATLAYCLDHPQWRLSIQTHKQLGIR